MMSGFGNPGGLLLVSLYLFIFQSIVAILGWKLKEKREKLLNWNILIGLFPLLFNIELLVHRYNDVLDIWNNFDWMLTFFCICAVLNIFFWMLSFLSRLNLLNSRWYFLVYINVIGSWIFLILI